MFFLLKIDITWSLCLDAVESVRLCLPVSLACLSRLSLPSPGLSSLLSASPPATSSLSLAHLMGSFIREAGAVSLASYGILLPAAVVYTAY